MIVQGEERLRPVEVTVVDEMAPGAVRRNHYAVRYAHDPNRPFSQSVAVFQDVVSDVTITGRLPPAQPSALHGPVCPPPIAHESDLWVIHLADSPITAAHLGYGTAWCTAYPSRLPIWRDYVGGELYVLQGRGSRKLRRTRYQLHIDEHGRIECERHDGRTMSMGEVRKRHPELAGWLGQKRLDADERGGC